MSDATHIRQRLAAILAADVAGYSRLMAQDDRSTITALEAARQVFKASIQAHHGRVIDMAGDSVLAVFDTAASAVSAALEVQMSLETSSASVPEDRRMQFRVGVHMGDITEMPDGSVYGEGVNMAARLEGLALPGGIIVSDAVRSSVRNRVAGVFEDLGEKQVKNFEDPVRAFRVRPKSASTSQGWMPRPLQAFTKVLRSPSRWWALAAGSIFVVAMALPFAWPNRSLRKVEPPLLSVAVLPFSVSEGPGNAELAQVLVLELTRRLGQTVVGHPVKSAAAVQAFRGDLHDSNAVGRDLDVRYVVRGDVTHDGPNIVVTAELVEARTRAQAWTARFATAGDRPNDAGELLALRILSQLRPALYEAQAKSLPKNASSDESALELAFRGLFVQSSLDFKTQIKASTEECDASLRLDPALALALLCKTWGRCERRREARQQAPGRDGRFECSRCRNGPFRRGHLERASECAAIPAQVGRCGPGPKPSDRAESGSVGRIRGIGKGSDSHGTA